ncbi:MAG TPA: DUF3352 domain-containing protein [Pyrinomonadaceae bacterium]
MNLITRVTAAILLVLVVLTPKTSAQQKRQTTPKPPPKSAAATPAPTFDTLLPADSYAVYVEVRGAGQLIRSSALNDLLEPILQLSKPPKEFKSFVKWLNAHAEQVMSSRLSIATWPMNNKGIPEVIVAIEFPSAEEAAKFATPLNEFLPTVVPPSGPVPDPKTESDKSGAAATPTPGFHLQRLGSVVLISPKPWTMKQLKPAGSKLLADDVNFRTARNRFNSEPIFVFIDMKQVKKQDEEQSKRVAEEARRQEEERLKQAQAEKEAKKSDEPSEPELTEEEIAAQEEERIAKLQPVPSNEIVGKEAATPDPIFDALSNVGSSFFSGSSDWPDAIALALSFDDESFDLRALLVNPPGEKTNVLPFLPKWIPGPGLVPEAPNIFPVNTDLLVTMSVDLPQIYTAMSMPPPAIESTNVRGYTVNINRAGFESPFAEIEKRLKINIKDDLLPLLGSEIAIRLPMTGMIGIPGVFIWNPEIQQEQSTSTPPVLAIAVKDKEALRALMPKLIDSMGFKGASSFAQTERREDTELVSYANLFSYAFVGNFIVLSADSAAVRQIVDSYLKHETLSGDPHFKNYTRWQPRQLQGQIYISPALMESYKTWAEQPSTRISDQTRAFFTRLTTVAQPITYALSNEGLGPLHEVHIPKNLVLMAVAGISGETNPPAGIQNERMAIGMMYMIAGAEQQYKTSKGNGNYATMEQLIAEDMVSKEMIENSAYKFQLTVTGDKFELTAVPSEYGKSGTLSLFTDHTQVLRGADHNGALANASDPPIK